MSRSVNEPIVVAVRNSQVFWIMGLQQSMAKTDEPARGGGTKEAPKTRSDNRSLYDVAMARRANGAIVKRIPKLQIWLNDDEAEELKNAITQLKDPNDEIAIVADVWTLFLDDSDTVVRMTLSGVRLRDRSS